MSEARYHARSGKLRRFAAPARPVHEVTMLAVSPLRLQALASRPDQLLGLLDSGEYNQIELRDLSNDAPLLVSQQWRDPTVLVLSGSVRAETQVRGGKHTIVVFAASVLYLPHSYLGLPVRTMLRPVASRALVAVLGCRPTEISW